MPPVIIDEFRENLAEPMWPLPTRDHRAIFGEPRARLPNMSSVEMPFRF